MSDGKTIGIISYITFIGWIIAIILHQENKKQKDLAAFHIRQTLLLYIIAIALSIIPVIGQILLIVLFVFWIIGLVGAAQGEKKPIPLLGAWAQDWFKGL